MKRLYSVSLARVLVVAAFALGLGLISRSDGYAVEFNPTVNITPSNLVAGSNPDLTVQLEIPVPSANFSAVISFIPTGTGLGACPANNPSAVTRQCADEAIPNGAVVGRVVADSTLGLLNGPCNSITNDVTFEMMDATTDMTTTVKFEDDPNDPDEKGEQFEDDDNDGVPNGAEMYPEYLLRLIHGPTPFGVPGGAPLQPLQRTYGQTVVANTDVSLTLLVMEPGITINGLPLNPADGYPVITVLQNTGDPGAVPKPGSITDFCSRLDSNATSYGITRDNPATAANEGGLVYATAPAPGDYPVSILLFSQRDDDNDGIENQLDTCPNEGNNGWDPRADNSPGDTDQDGIPDICDAFPNSQNTDADGDGFLNRGDNCPQAANPLQTDLDRDGIGGGCDTNDTMPSTHIHAFPPDYFSTGETTIGTVTLVPGRQGDANCNLTTDAVDALQILRYVAALPPQAACINLAADVNCDGERNAVDALQVLRHVAGLPVNQPETCVRIGDPLT